MNRALLLRTAIAGLRVNRVRSVLTILGIIIGVTAIVMVVALGQGAQGLILAEIEGIGGNTVIIRPGRQPEGPTDIADTILSDSIKQQDIEALNRRENVPGITSIEPGVIVPGSVTREDQIYRPLTLGWTGEGLLNLFNLDVAEGTIFTEEDIRQRAKVVILGHTVKQELFGDSNALGEFVSIRGHKLRVIGLLPKTGQTSFLDFDELMLMPYTTAQRTLLNIDFFHEVVVKLDEGADPRQVAEDVRATLRETHGITDSSKDDFFVLTQEEIASNIATVTNVLTIFLVAIASISLVVGGVGIMNIMLVSVTERTKEIGLRKAVGATDRNIMQQFLIEAVILTGTGGVIGTILATIFSSIVAIVARNSYGVPWPVTVPVTAIVLGVGTAALIGIIFGIYPARQAAKKDPIEALRYE